MLFNFSPCGTDYKNMHLSTDEMNLKKLSERLEEEYASLFKHEQESIADRAAEA